MTERPRFHDAPGLAIRPMSEGWEARWQCRTDLAARGFTPKSVALWTGTEPTEIERVYVSDNCRRLQDEMLVFGRGGVQSVAGLDGTIRSLVAAYQTDPNSPYHNLRYQIRVNYSNVLGRIIDRHGDEMFQDVRAGVFLAWHKEWSADGTKLPMGKVFIGMLRTLIGFGATFLEDPECIRLKGVLSGMRFKTPKPRSEFLTAEMAIAVRAKAHEWGWPSIALAQAFQFELALRQKDVIGEWVPVKEPGVTDVTWDGRKWLHGLRWSEIDKNMILRHQTSKTGKLLEVNLSRAVMVVEELAAYEARNGALPAVGPIVVCEGTGKPWGTEFRRKWRWVAKAAGIPDSVKNMDTRSGAITEATDSGADLEHVRHAATHSNISMTQRYSRGAADKVDNVMQLRQAHRNKPRTSD
jgi:hypothetical protein